MTQPDNKYDDAVWERSGRCDTNTCVEVAPLPAKGQVLVRDGKNPTGHILAFDKAGWDQFLDDIIAGNHRFE